MKLKLTQHILSLFLLFVILPLGVMAEDADFKISVCDVIVPKGEIAQLGVSVSGGKAPYTIFWSDNSHILHEPTHTLLESGYSSTTVRAKSSSDFNVTVKDANGVIRRDVLRLIVTDYKISTASFENTLSNNPRSHFTTYKKSSVPNEIGWNTSFLSGSFVFSSLTNSSGSSKNKETGFSFSKLRKNDADNDTALSPYASVVGSGYQNSSVYAVVTDSAFVTYADPFFESRPVSGFYISNSLALYKAASDFKNVHAYVTITNMVTGKSLVHNLIDTRPESKDANSNSDTWDWVDLRSLNFTKGSLKLKLDITCSDTKKLDLPMTFCIDDFGGRCSTTDVSAQMVGVNSTINLDDVIPQYSSIPNSQYSIYSIDGGYPENAKFEIKNKQLVVNASQCNVKITIKVSSKSENRYFTIPLIVDGDRLSAGFDEVIETTPSLIPGNTLLRNGSYVFSSDDDARSAFYYSDDLPDSESFSAISELNSEGNRGFVIMANSGYIYNMCHNDSISGFYIKLSDKTYRAVVDGENIGGPYRQGDSLILYVSDTENGKELRIPLADYTYAKESDNYCIKSWQWVSLKPLGLINSLHLTLAGSKFSKNNFIPECYIDNFGMNPIVTRLNSVDADIGDDGKIVLSLDSCLGRISDPLIIYNYELESVNGGDSSCCAKITDGKLCVVSSHNRQMDLLLKSSLNGSTEYVLLPLNIRVLHNNNDTASTTTSESNSRSKSEKKDNVRGKTKDTTGNHSSVRDSSNTVGSASSADNNASAPVDSLKQKDAPSEDKCSATPSNEEKSKNTSKGLNKKSNTKETANTEEPTDMRIVYSMLFLFVLLILLMYMYNKRQRSRINMELESLRKRYAESIALYDKAKDEIASLSALKQKYRETVAACERVQQEIDSLSALNEKYPAAVAEIERLKKEIESLTILKQKYSEELAKNEQNRVEIESLKQVQKKYDDALNENEKLAKVSANMKSEFEKKLKKEKTEVERLKNLLSSYQDNVNPEEWNAEQNLLEHETVIQLHRDVDGAHMASERQWSDLSGVVSKLLPEFYTALSSKSDTLSDNEFKVCLLTRLKFLPTEMAVLLNLSKQRITNIRAAVNKKLFDENGTKTFEGNIFNLGN